MYRPSEVVSQHGLPWSSLSGPPWIIATFVDSGGGVNPVALHRDLEELHMVLSMSRQRERAEPTIRGLGRDFMA